VAVGLADVVGIDVIVIEGEGVSVTAGIGLAVGVALPQADSDIVRKSSRYPIFFINSATPRMLSQFPSTKSLFAFPGTWYLSENSEEVAFWECAAKPLPQNAVLQ